MFGRKIQFDVKASFASRPESRQSGDITNQVYNKRISIKGYLLPRDFSWIENYKLGYHPEINWARSLVVSGLRSETKRSSLAATTLDKIFGTKLRNPVKLNKTSKGCYLILRVF